MWSCSVAPLLLCLSRRALFFFVSTSFSRSEAPEISSSAPDRRCKRDPNKENALSRHEKRCASLSYLEPGNCWRGHGTRKPGAQHPKRRGRRLGECDGGLGPALRRCAPDLGLLPRGLASSQHILFSAARSRGGGEGGRVPRSRIDGPFAAQGTERGGPGAEVRKCRGAGGY